MVCPACATENPDGARFCGGCGAALGQVCSACGVANDPGMRFCTQCGSALGAEAPAVSAAPAASPRAQAAAERRHVSVLFVDLVGFTNLSESRDAEEVRELLSRYFDTCKRLISLYGGTIEKFIGDAVMAVWGTPTATEDDAERAVRAALDVITSVTALGEELGAPDLRARAGVLTGEAAVTIGAEGEGMVAGDLVNTASRIQSVAEPGTVLVGASTREATEAAIAYVDAGSHELKGKAEPVPLSRAQRVVSGRQGALKSQGLEAPFVGRDRELRQIKDLYHASADEKKAHLVSITGIAGIGKSRLGWEFYKYFDGLVENVYWHRGRCLSYGEGVTYWALADMIRMRCRIGEDEEPASAAAKLRATLEEHILDADERSFVEPALAQLLGLAEHRAGGDKQDLFAAWRLFFERLAETYPTVLAFEDLQWADASLLDFIEYLLEWSRNHPLYVLTLARPELAERRPGWGAGQRNFSSLYLEPLSQPAMEELLSGLVPGLPPDLRDQILGRSEGVPLYAVETVRMLLDRGALVLEGSVYRPVAEIATLEVPETLHALIAARLDGLAPNERRLLQDGAVLGKMFTRTGIAAVSGLPDGELTPLLQSLVRKEILSVQADPRSPEHGQYGFLQDLVRRVAYETLSRRERRTRHLAAAAHLEAAFRDEDEIVEVIASHYLDAHQAVPDAEDASDIRKQARAALVRAGDRAEALGAPAEAQRYVEKAAGLAEGRERAALLDRAGWASFYAADYDVAARLLGESVALYEADGERHAAARVSGRLAYVERFQGLVDESLARAERAFEVIAGDEPDEDLASLAAMLAGGYVFAGDHERGDERNELALEIAESLGFAEVLTRALSTKAIITIARGRPQEALALLKHGLAIALEHELWERALTLGFNVSDVSFQQDRYDDALGYLREALEHTRRRGNRPGEWSLVAETTYALYMTGRWEEALAAATALPEDRLPSATTNSLLTSVLQIHINRGDPDEAQRLLSLYAEHEHSADVQDRAIYLGGAAAVRRAEGLYDDAVALGLEATELARRSFGIAAQPVKQGLVEAVEAALALGDRARAGELLAIVDSTPPGLRPPYLEAQGHRLRARLSGSDEPAAEAGYAAAAESFRALGIPFWRAVTLLEHGEWLVGLGRGEEAEPLLTEARETFERLEATPWLERLESVADREAGAVSARS